MVRGVKEATKGAPMFIFAIVFSGSLAWVSMGLGAVIEGRQLSTAFWPSLFLLFGGFLFGVGAAINSGCGGSTVSRLALLYISGIALCLCIKILNVNNRRSAPIGYVGLSLCSRIQQYAYSSKRFGIV